MAGTERASAAAPVLELFDIRKLLAVFRRRLPLFIVVGALVFTAVAVAVFRATPLYTAQASVALDTRRARVVESQSVISDLPAQSEGVVDTEVEILKSRRLAERVVDQLNLMSDPRFRGVVPAPIPGVELTRAQQQRREQIASALLGGLRVRRAGLTYIIYIGYVSPDPVLAARLANAFADAYIIDQLETKFEGTRQANTWLSGRLAQLRGEVLAAETAVERYKTANNLLSAQGATLTEQEISAYNQQLASARTQLAEEEARLRTARAQLAGGSTGDDVGEALGSTVVSTLRSQRAALSGRVADLQGRYGPRHPELLKAERELADIDAQIQSEIQRLVSNLEARAQVARDRVAAVQGSLGGARGTLAANNAAGVRLAELERNAQSAKTLYESYLNRFRETSSQEGITQSDARVVSRALTPRAPSSPNVPLYLGMGMVLAFGAGLAAIILAEMLYNGLATADEVERKLGVRCVAGIPHLKSVAARADRRMAPTAYVLAKPLSGFTEAFRSIRTALLFARQGEPVVTVAVTSALPEEGKTTTAICLARTAAQSGAQVVLVDFDLRRRSATSLLARNAERGVLEFLTGECTLDEALVLDEQSGAYILPAPRSAAAAGGALTPETAEQVLEALARRFDFVVIDTAPALAVAETRIVAAKAHVTLVVTKWRKTPEKAVDAALRMLEDSGANVAGVALAQVDMRQQSKYGYGDPGLYYASYSKYYA